MIKFIKGVHPSYKQQFDKLTEAYIRMEVNPYDACGCFVGNLLNRTDTWIACRMSIRKPSFVGGLEEISTINMRMGIKSIAEISKGLYTAKEILMLEKVFMDIIKKSNIHPFTFKKGRELVSRSDENVLFEAFSETLETLKHLHISKGELVDADPVFQRRELTFH